MLVAAITAPAQVASLVPAWNQMSPTSSPPARFNHATAYDVQDGQVVLFGGQENTGGGLLNDTWLWNGTNWSQANPSNSPSQRIGMSMAYDAANGTVVLFGGVDSSFSTVGDTWVWNGTTWTAAATTGPPARCFAAMAYDAATSSVLLFGGVGVGGNVLSDAWIWNGSSWSQVPGGPSARANHSMAYDAANGTVVLFGGTSTANGGSGSYLSDTWVWNGTSWTVGNAVGAPSARSSQGMAYDAALGEVVLFGGFDDSYLGDTWLWNGTNWISSADLGPSGREVPNDLTYDSARNQLVLFGGFNGSAVNDTWEFGPSQNFGNVNVCQSGQITPSPCSNTLTLTFTVPTTTTYGTPVVTTQGAPGLDFQLSQGGTDSCIGGLTAGSSCSVSVTFAPTAPGLRAGAVNLVTSSGTLVASAPIYGVGQAPEMVYSPAIQNSAILYGPSLENVVTVPGYTLTPHALATDAAGDLFIADPSNPRVVELTASGTASTVGVGFSSPQAIAVDGAGDVFIADTGLQAVLEVPAGCTTSSCQTVVYNPSGTDPVGLAVDGLGDLFIADESVPGVFEIPSGCATSSCWIAVGSGWSKPSGLAVDSSGDLFVADSGLGEVLEMTPGCTVIGCQTTVGSGWQYPQGVAVDAAGDVYVADSGLRQLLQVPVGCTSISCEVPLVSGTISYNVAVDAAGQVYVSEPQASVPQVIKINQSPAQTPLLKEQFLSAIWGTISTDSPQSVTILNVGNQPLVDDALYWGQSWVQTNLNGNPADCAGGGNGFTLQPGQSCNVSTDFEPEGTGTDGYGITSAIYFYTNTLNGSFALNNIDLAGGVPAGTSQTLTVTLAGSGSGTVLNQIGNNTPIDCSETNGSASGTCSLGYLTGQVVMLTETATPGSLFTGWGGVCAAYSTTNYCFVTMNAAESVTASFVPSGASAGSVNVCPFGQSSPAPCNTNTTITVNVPAGTTVGSVQVVTEGQASNDFQYAGGDTCTGNTFPSASTCTVNVTFTPQAPGLRLGALELLNGTSIVVTQQIYGIGQGPVAAFSPLTSFFRYLGGPNGNCGNAGQPACASLNAPQGVTLDLQGDVYISDTGNHQVLELIGNSTNPVYSGGTTSAPQGLAIDGAGDLFVADSGLGEVIEIAAQSGAQTVVYTGVTPTGVAIDGAGDLFIADGNYYGGGNGGVVWEFPADGSGQTQVYSDEDSVPVGVAVDSAGDVFVTDTAYQQVVEIPLGCNANNNNNCQVNVGSGWSRPEGVAVDAAGDVYVTDTGLNSVVDVPVGCINNANNCQITLADNVPSFGVAVDANGVVNYVSYNSGGLLQILQDFYGLSFGDDPAQTATASQTITLQNVGNQPLNAVNTGFTITDPDFIWTNSGATGACATAFSLTPGGVCSVSIDFSPLSAGSYNDDAIFSDNSLNNPSATQDFTLAGTGVAGPANGNLLTVSDSGSGSGTVTWQTINCVDTSGTTSGLCVEYETPGSNATLTASATGGSAFAGWGGACASSGMSPTCIVNMSSAESVSATFAAPGSATITLAEVGTGSGSVADDQSQISCSETNRNVTGTCLGSYGAGTSVTLTATTNANSTFAGWGGACASSGASTTCVLTVNSALNVSASFVAAGSSQASSLKPITAGVVYGQGGSFTSANGNNGGLSASSLYQPDGLVVDSNGNVYAADLQNNRVLYYPAGSTTATRVYGQGGDFTSGSPNNGGISADSLNNPYGLALDSGGNLYIADENNNRVLYYPAGSTTATRVYGQNGSFTTNNANSNGVSATSLYGPQSVAVDASGNLYVADTLNNRVLFYPAGSTTATQVYGQGGSFSSTNVNNGGIGANTLWGPYGVTLDSSGNLYIADTNNNRVLFYPYNNTTPTQVYGQVGFTDAAANYDGVSANSFNSPQSVAVDSSGNVYVADYNNNRVVVYPSGSTTATVVYGQRGIFTSSSANTNANGLSTPAAVALDASGNLYVADKSNNRLLEYGSFGNVNVCSSGQSTPAPCNGTITYSYYAAAQTTFGPPQVVTQGTTGLDFSPAAGGTCTGNVAAGNACTVNVSFAPLAPGLRTGAVTLVDGASNVLASAPAYGVGQGPAAAFGPGTQLTVPATGLSSPSGVALDGAGDVYISDYTNNQVVEVTPGGVQTTVPTSGLNNPRGVAVDGAGDLFIADEGNARVVEIPAGCTAPACQITVTVSGLQQPYGVAVDGAGDLFIADAGTAQVVKVTPSGVQSTVPATGLSGPFGVAVDAAGDVFIADTYGNQVVEVSAGGVQTIVPAVGVTSPEDVWVDAAGDVFIADSIPNNRIVEVPAGGGAQTTLYTGNAPEGVVTDGAGDVFIADTLNAQVLELQSSTATVNLGAISQSYQSSDTPLSIQNIGNQTLTGTVGAVIGAGIFEDTGTSTCGNGSGFSLTAGASCVENFYATTSAVGTISGTALVSDNALNGAPATQSVSISGLSVGLPVTVSVTGGGTGSGLVQSDPAPINCSIIAGVTSAICSTSYSTGLSISFEEVPISGSTFTGWGGACANAGTNQICSVTISGPTIVTANFAVGSTTNYALTVTEVGTGSGSVTDNQSQISCSEASGTVSGTCAGSYASGTSVVLNAVANGTSTFVGWGGACSSFGAGPSCTVAMNSALNVSASFVAPGASQAGTLRPITAGLVYGQGGSFTSGTANHGGTSANSLSSLGAVVVDANGNLYVADASNNRVLFYPAGSTTATRVYGQNGSFTTGSANNGGISANSLSNPQGLALDSAGNLYVADQFNNRVLFFPAGSTTATQVYGQNGSFTTNTPNLGGVSATSLNQPYGLAVDSGGNLYVSDNQNSRVLFYPSGSTTATQVYGQGGSFTTGSANQGGLNANSLNQPTGLALDSSGDLYVADLSDNRVLFFPYGSTTATQVYGQGSSFTSSGAGTGNGGLNNPMYVALDSSGDLYVTDRSNNRVLFYPFGSTTATRVYGQLNSFNTAAPNNGGTTANSLSEPWGVALDSTGNVYVSDYNNNRVLEYGSFGNVNVCPTGQATPTPCNSTVTLSYYTAAATNFGATQVLTQGVAGLDFSLAGGGTCTGTVAAQTSCTVNATFVPLAPGSRIGAVELFNSSGSPLATAPVYGVGQAPAIAFGPGTQTAVGTGTFTLSTPKGVLIDANGNLFISDTTKQQVLKITPTGTISTVGSGFLFPQGMAEDGAGNLFVADNNLNQVVEIPAGCTTSSCQQYVPNPLNLTSQLGVAVDGAGDLFISDYQQSKVAKVPANGGAQTLVYNPTPGCGGGAGCSHPIGLATDAAGDLFITDDGLLSVVEVPAGCTVSSCQKTIGSGWVQPDAVAVDAAGDVFVADYGLNEVVEVPAGCSTSACQVVLSSGLNPIAVAVDPSGDLVIDSLANSQVATSQIFEVNRSQAPSLSFGITNVGSASTPTLVSIQNVGNQPLAGSVTLSTLSANFTQNATPDCSGAFPLAPGAICSESFTFTPQTTGYLTGTASFSVNTLNLSASVDYQPISLSGTGGINGQAVSATVPNVVGMSETEATTVINSAGLTLGTVSSGYSNSEPANSIIGESPAAGTSVDLGTAVAIKISSGQAPPPTPNPLTFENNYFVTGDFASAGALIRGPSSAGLSSGTITIPDLTTCACAQGVPDGADIIDGFLYWTTLENTASPSGTNGTFLGYAITGQQVGTDVAYTDATSGLSGTLRVYRADINTYFPVATNGSGSRVGSGSFAVSLPNSGSTAQLPLNLGADLVVIYRILSTAVPLKSVVIYDGSAVPASSTTQTLQGFYDAVGGAGSPAKVATLDYSAGAWSGSPSPATLGADASQYTTQLNPGSAYAAMILSTPVANSDNDGILNAWKKGPPAGDFFVGQPGYYDVKTNSWVALPGAKQGEKDLFVQLDYMCATVNADGTCGSGENLFPSPDPSGNDPLLMVKQAFLQSGIVLHLQIGNAVPETSCTDASGQLCQFPSTTTLQQPGVIGWKNSLEFSKLWPRNFTSCAAGGDCTTRFPYGQKDSYHYVLIGHSLAIPAWSSRSGSLTGITVNGDGTTTIATTDRGTGINKCPSRVTIAGVLGDPSLNGVYNTTGCSDTLHMTVATPGVTAAWSYPNKNLAEPVIGITSGTVTSISGYSDLGGADSAVTLALWETAPNQDMSKRAQVVAGTLFHEIGHTLGLSHGGIYYDSPTAGDYTPTFEANCKPNLQSSMNYLFQLDGVGPNASIAYSNQTLSEILYPGVSSTTQLVDTDAGFTGTAPTFSTSSWYTPTPPNSTVSAATLHCDGTPLTGDTGYRVSGPVAPITPAWVSGQNVTFDGQSYTQLRGYNEVANLDLRQLGATGGEFVSLSSVLNFGSSSTPLSVPAGGSATVGAGGTVALGTNGTMTLVNGGNVTVGGGAVISGGGTIALNTGGSATVSAGGVVTPGSSGLITLGGGGTVTLNGTGTITLSSGGNVVLGGGGTVTLGAGGGTITLNSGLGTVSIPATGGVFTIPATGGTIALGGGGTVTLGGGGNVTLGAGGTIALGAGGNVTLGGGGNVTLGAGGTIALGGGGTVTLGGGGNITLGGGGVIALGGGGTITLGGGGNVTLGGGGNVTLGGGGNVSVGAGGNVTLGAGGNVTLGAGGNVTLGAGGNVTLSNGGTIALGGGGNVTLGGGGTVTLGAGGATINGVPEPPGGPYPVSAGGVIALGAGGTVTLGGGGNVTLGGGGTITLGGGGTVTLGGGGNVTLGGGGVVALGAGGNITLGGGGNITLGGGGTVALGGGGTITLGGGGATTNEMTYDTANSVVRPPVSPGYTPTAPGVTPAGNIISWNPPAFGVVQTYTIYRSIQTNGTATTPVEIGSVSGVNSNPPATTFTDTNPPSGTLLYTITTTLVPDNFGASRQSLPSTPAVVKNNQTIVLGSLPSSVSIANSPYTITATVMSGGTLVPVQVNFSASGSCSTGSQSISGNVSSVSVSLNSTGSCNISATQPGTTQYVAATPVSGTFMVEPQGSNLQSQTISSIQVLSGTLQYGSAFSVTATSSSGLPVTFSAPANGPCTVNATTGAVAVTAAGSCVITASAAQGQPANSSTTYSAASVTNSFSILPAALTVTANSLSSTYGQPLPTLTYTFGSLVNGDSLATAISGTPALTTTATSGSIPGPYPITVTTGTLAAANYSFVYVSGTLTIQKAAATISISNIPTGAVYGGSFTPTYLYSGTGTPTESVASTTASVCTVSGSVVSFVGVGSCTLTASATATTDDLAATGTPQSFTVGQASQSITFTQPATPVTYGVGPISLSATATSGLAVVFSVDASSTGTGTISGSTLTVTGAGNLVIDANQTGNADYAPAPLVQRTIVVNKAAATISVSNIPTGAVYGGSFTPTYLYSGTGTPTESVASTTASVCTVSGSVVSFVGVGSCTLTASATATTDDLAATGTPQSFTVGQASQSITFTQPATPVTYGVGPITLSASSTSGLTVAFSIDATSTATGSISGSTLTVTGAGNLVIDASQTGNADYAAAPLVQRTIVVNKAAATISISNIPTGAVYGGSFTPTYLYSGTGTPTESVSSTTASVCTVSGSVVSFVGVGSCTLTASATATTDDLAATGTPQSFTVGQASQSITFTQPATPVTYGVGPITLSASSTSGLTVAFSIDATSTATGSISGSTLTVTGAGNLVIDANQTGNADYAAAPLVQRTIVVNKATATISIGNIPTGAVYGGSFTPTYLYSGTGTPTESVASTTASVCTVSGSVVSFVGVGSCTLTASAGATAANAPATGTPQSFTVGQASQSITFTQPATPVTYGVGPITLSASSTSGLTVAFSIDATSTATGSISGSTLTLTGAGNLVIDANQTGNADYAAAPLVQRTIVVNKATATISISNIPTGAVYGGSFTPTYLYSGTGTPTESVASTTASVCTVSGNLVSFVGVGSCTLTASAGGTAANAPATGTPQSFTVGQASQSITFTTAPPTSAAYGTSFTVAATASSGLAVAYSSAGSCTDSGTNPATYTITASTGTCSVIASQAGNSNYAAATPVTKTVTTTGTSITVTPTSINFGSVTVNSVSIQSITVTNSGTSAATISTPVLSILKAGNADEYVAVSLCPSSLAAGKSCNVLIGFYAGAYYGTPQTATLKIVDSAANSPQLVSLTATVLEPQTITFTTNPPSSANYNSSFTVAATASSGLAVTYTSSGSCSNSGATYTMTSGTGSCSVIANQSGNSTYAPATQVTKTVTAARLAQTISFATNPPASAVYNSRFTVAASATSGLAVTYTSSGSCSNSGATYTMTGGTGTCSVIANQAGNSNYAAATQVTKTTSATPASQTITFSTAPPASAVYKSSFTVAASATSGLAVTYTSSGSCSNSGATYTMTTGTGTCSVIASQAGNSNYSAAAAMTKTVSASYATASLTPASLSFGTVASGKSSAAQTATLTNTGTTPLIIGSIGFTGASPGNFSQTNTCPASSSSLAAGAKCTISVTFKSGGKAVTASLSVTDNTSSAQSVSLSGN